MKKENSNAIATRPDTGLGKSYPSFWDEVDLLKSLPSRQQPADPIAFVARNKVSRDDKGRYVIAKREKPLKIFDEDGHTRVVEGLSYGNTASNRMGFQQGMRRGKYNDEGRLMFNDYGTVELGETISAGAAF